MTVRNLLRSVDSRELSEWLAYFNLSRQPADNQLTNTERIKAYFVKKGKK